MKLEAKQRLLADEKSDRAKRQELQKKIDTAQEKIENLKKGLPSKLNRMKVSAPNQINKRKEVLKEEMKIQDLRKQKLRYQEEK